MNKDELRPVEYCKEFTLEVGTEWRKFGCWFHTYATDSHGELYAVIEHEDGKIEKVYSWNINNLKFLDR